MPEGDTIHRAARTLHQALAGRVVTGFDTALAALARVDDQAPIVGRRVLSASARGKHLVIELSGDLLLRTHMRMSGSWHLYRPGERWRRPSASMRILLVTDAFEAVAFDVHDAEFVARDGAERSVLGRLGPDLLAPDFDEHAALERLARHPDRTIAATLLDQRVMAGIGNVYKSEVLFICGIHADTLVRHVDEQQRRALVRTARRLLQANVPAPDGLRSPTRGERRTTGRMSRDEGLWVYERAGRPCRRCGTAIEWRRTGPDERSTFWCPACQPRKAPGGPDQPADL